MKSFFNTMILVAVLLSGCKQPEKKVEAVKPVKYQRISSSKGELSYKFSGTVKAKSETNLSFKVGGTLNLVNIKPGDKVKKGQLIASIDPSDYNIQKEKAVAQKKSTASQLENARSSFLRIEKLYERNSVALSEFEKAKVNLSSAKSQHEAAIKQLEAAENQVSYTKVYAPMDGVISSVSIDANETIGAGITIAVLSSEGNPQVEVDVSESSINKLKIGQKASIEFSSINGKQFSGEVVEIAFASGKSTTYPVTLNINNAVSQIRPGMSAEVNFIIVISDIANDSPIIAPIAAVGKDSESNYVFVLHPHSDGIYIVEKRNIEVVRLLTDGFEVKNGLEGNELVATAGLTFLRDNMKVKLLESK